MRKWYGVLALAVVSTVEGRTLTLNPIDAAAETQDGSTWTIDPTAATLVSQRPTIALEKRGVMEFDLSLVPAGPTRPAADTVVRGTAVDGHGRLGVYNGTTAPYASTYDAGAGAWAHRTAAGLSTVQSTALAYGAVATVGSYVFATDMTGGAGALGQTSGLVRFNTFDESVSRVSWATVPGSGNAHFVTRGLDGLVYALGDVAGGAQRMTVRAFNPYSGALLRTVTLPVQANAIAVGATGEIFATTPNGSVYDFTPAGATVKSLAVAGELQGIDLWTDGTIVLGSRQNGVRVTDTALASSTTMVPYAGASTAFVTFATPAPERGWKNDSTGLPTTAAAPSWSDAGNWSGPVPGASDGGADSIAVFGGRATGNRGVRLDASRTVGTLVFDSQYQYSLTAASGAALTMDVPAGQRAMIDVVRGAHQLRLPVTLQDDLTVRTAMGSAVSFPPTFGAPAGRLDIGSHNVIWDYAVDGVSPATSIRAGLSAGRGSAGAWAGPGIISSVAAADAGKFTGVGWAEAEDLGITTYAGQAVDASAVIIQVAPYGDANLNGAIDAGDYALLDRGMAGGLAGWVNGDFDYDGAVTSGDYLLIDKGYAHQTGLLSPELVAAREARFGAAYMAELVASVPEPGCLAPAPLAAVVSLRRRSR